MVTRRRFWGEEAMEEHFVWMTTRRIKPGRPAEFERAWRPDTHPDGMLRAYAHWSEDEQHIIAVSLLVIETVVRCVADVAGRSAPAPGHGPPRC
jgi:hypothetical protein